MLLLILVYLYAEMCIFWLKYSHITITEIWIGLLFPKNSTLVVVHLCYKLYSTHEDAIYRKLAWLACISACHLETCLVTYLNNKSSLERALLFPFLESKLVSSVAILFC